MGIETTGPRLTGRIISTSWDDAASCSRLSCQREDDGGMVGETDLDVEGEVEAEDLLIDCSVRLGASRNWLVRVPTAGEMLREEGGRCRVPDVGAGGSGGGRVEGEGRCRPLNLGAGGSGGGRVEGEGRCRALNLGAGGSAGGRRVGEEGCRVPDVAAGRFVGGTGTIVCHVKVLKGIGNGVRKYF